MGLASGAASASGNTGQDSNTLAFHCPYGTPVDYAFETTGGVTSIDHAPHLDIPDGTVSADRGSTMEDGVATGTVNGGYDVYAYEGELVGFEITSGDCAALECWNTGDSADACELAARLPRPGETSSSDPTAITACRTIDEPGHYVLGADLTGGNRDVCIEITADDVVLDGQSHVIDGETDGAVGLRVTGNDVAVRDVEVRDWDTCVELRGDRTLLWRAMLDNTDEPLADRAIGLDVADATACAIRDVEVIAGHEGVRMESATDVLLADSAIAGLTFGTVLERATGCVLRNNESGSGGSEGLVMTGSDDNLLHGNLLGGFGIAVSVHESHRNVFRTNEFATSDDYALALSNCEGLALLDNDVSGSFSGFSLQDVTDSVLFGNAANDTSNDGIQLEGGSSNVLAQNAANRNDDAGIELTETSGNLLFGNTARENSLAREQAGGVRLVDADDNVVVRNVVCDNGGPDQIVVEGTSAGNLLSDNDTDCSS